MQSNSKIDDFLMLEDEYNTLSIVPGLGEEKVEKGGQEAMKRTETGPPDRKDSYDLVIVGGGVAGVYTLWNLLTDPKYGYIGKKILLIEQCPNLGGRLVTDLISSPTMDNIQPNNGYSYVSKTENIQKCEEGGMRFCRDWHVMPLLNRLINTINNGTIPPKLDFVDFPMKPEGLDCRRLWFNGEKFTEWYAQQNPGIWGQLFGLEEKERMKSPEEIFAEAYTTLLKENRHKLIALVGADDAEVLIRFNVNVDYKKIREIQQREKFWNTFRMNFTWGNVALVDYSMKSLLTQMGYSQGCIMMLTEATGFWCYVDGPGNAGVILQMITTHATMAQDFKCFKLGFHQLIDVLHEAVKDKCTIKTQHQLRSIKPTHTSELLGARFQLHIQQLPPQPLTNQDPQQIELPDPYIVTTKKIILAVPQKALQKIYLKCFDEGAIIPRHVKWPHINTVAGVEMTKINLYFDYPWWNEKCKATCKRLYGGNTTNLPLAQVYTFYSYTDLPEPAKQDIEQSGGSDFCCVTVYCDITSSKYWSDLQDPLLGPPFTSKLQMSYRELRPASIPVVKEVLREFEMLFDTKDIPYPVLTTYTRWNGEPGAGLHGDAIHQWKKNVNDRTVIEQISEPFAGAADEDKEKFAGIYVCNEAWSNFQGWVEGSLEAAQQVLKHFAKQT